MPAYVPTSPVAKTLSTIVPIIADLTAVKTMLRGANQAEALARSCPGDSGFLIGKPGTWDGNTMTVAGPPAIIYEAQAPEYALNLQNAWTVTHQIDMHLLHKREPTDTAVDAYLRAWDEHNNIQMAIKALIPNSLVLDGIFTAEAPTVFGHTAPPALQQGYISTLALRYTKGQP